MHDVFISYEKETKTIADNIVNTLETHKIRCWYAPRDVEGSYAQSIVTAINKAKIFIIILNEKASHSNHVLNEVESAYKAMDDSGLVIIPFKVSNEVLSDAMTYYIKRFHWIDAANHTLGVAIDELLSKVRNTLGIKETIEEVKAREQNKYFSYKDDKELKRLSSQRNLLNRSVDKVFKETKEMFSNPVVLDIGSNDGYLTTELALKTDAKLTIGLEYDLDAVTYAKETYGNEKIHFYQIDLEAPNVNDKMKEILKKHEVEYVDVIHISMVLLHLENPFKVLRTLRRFIRVGGKIIIRDIDDGFTLAYPDEKGLFSHAIKMVARNPRWGYRESGREIYTTLKKLCFTDIKLENLGINTVNMSFDDKEALYLTYFGSILPDLEYLVEHEPSNKVFIEDRNWILENQDEMEMLFYQKSFFFTLGFVLFTAIAED